MQVIDLFQYISTTDEFRIWQSSKFNIIDDLIHRFTPDLGVNLTNKCKLNCKHCCFRLYLKDEVEFDNDKFFKFLEKYLIEFKNAGYTSLKLHFNCGELSLLSTSYLLSFINRCLMIYKKYNMKLSFRINSNLVDINDDTLLFFKVCKEISDSYNESFVFYTSIDRYHFEDGDFKDHYKTIQRFQKAGIDVTANLMLTNRKELLEILDYYKSLNIKYVALMTKDWENMDNPINTFNEATKLYQDHEDIIQKYNIKRSYHISGCSLTPLKSIYTYNNTIVQCPLFAAFVMKDGLYIEPDNFNSIQDIHNSLLYTIQRYLIYNVKNSKYNMCPILYYYNQHQGLLP